MVLHSCGWTRLSGQVGQDTGSIDRGAGSRKAGVVDRSVAMAVLIGGFIGGFGFSTANCIKLVAMKSDLATNWHNIMEQTYGFINGIGVAAAMGYLAARSPPVVDEPPHRRWTHAFAVFFVLIGITYVNLVKNPEEWVKAGRMPATLYGLSAGAWFNLGYAVLAAASIGLLARHLRQPLPVVPTDAPGKGQLLYLTFLWWMVIGSFERALPTFQPGRLVTEGIIHLNAVICTLLVLLGTGRPRPAPPRPATIVRPPLGRAAVAGIAAMIFCVLAQAGTVLGVYGGGPADQGRRHIRFGPDATATIEKPPPGVDHP